MKLPNTFLRLSNFCGNLQKPDTYTTLNKKRKTFFAPFTPPFATHPQSLSQTGFR